MIPPRCECAHSYCQLLSQCLILNLLLSFGYLPTVLNRQEHSSVRNYKLETLALDSASFIPERCSSGHTRLLCLPVLLETDTKSVTSHTFHDHTNFLPHLLHIILECLNNIHIWYTSLNKGSVTSKMRIATGNRITSVFNLGCLTTRFHLRSYIALKEMEWWQWSVGKNFKRRGLHLSSHIIVYWHLTGVLRTNTVSFSKYADVHTEYKPIRSVFLNRVSASY